MKKILALMLLASLTAVVSGCGGESATPPKTEDPKSASAGTVQGTLVKLSVPNMT